MKEPDCVREATRAYFDDKDSVQSFLDFATTPDATAKVSKAELYKAYVDYCQQEAMDALGINDFGVVMKRKRVEDTRDSKTRSWKGIRIGQANEYGGWLKAS